MNDTQIEKIKFFKKERDRLNARSRALSMSKVNCVRIVLGSLTEGKYDYEENEKYKPVHNENFNVSWLLDNVVGDQGTIEIHLENKIIVVDYVSSNFNGSEVLDWNETERSSNDF